MPEMALGASTWQGARSMPRVRQAETTRFVVGDQKGYLTVGSDTDGAVGEVTLRIAKQGSTLAGVMDALGTAITLGLQAGAPIDDYVEQFSHTRFPPAGRTDDPELPQATSVLDYVARRVAIDSIPTVRHPSPTS